MERASDCQLIAAQNREELNRTGVNKATSRSVRFLRPRFPKLRKDRGPQACRADRGQGYECHPDRMNCRHVDLHADRPDCGRVGEHGSGRPWSVQIRTEFDWVFDARRLCRAPWSRQIAASLVPLRAKHVCASGGSVDSGNRRFRITEWPPRFARAPDECQNLQIEFHRARSVFPRPQALLGPLCQRRRSESTCGNRQPAGVRSGRVVIGVGMKSVYVVDGKFSRND